MPRPLFVIGEALMDCIVQPDGSLRPVHGGSPYNLARVVARQGVSVRFLNPFSTDIFGKSLKEELLRDGVAVETRHTQAPTSLAIVDVRGVSPKYSFYREGVADRDYSTDEILELFKNNPPGIFHTGSLLLIPPEGTRIVKILESAKSYGWTISLDLNMRPTVAKDVAAYVKTAHLIASLADWIKASDEDLDTMGFDLPPSAHIEQLRKTFPGAQRIALTYGDKGASLMVGDELVSSPAPKVDVTDTIGAGDTFWGTLLTRWVEQATDSETCIESDLGFAIGAAAITCTRAGCAPPTTAEIQTYLEKLPS
jgi:fructokinase